MQGARLQVENKEGLDWKLVGLEMVDEKIKMTASIK